MKKKPRFKEELAREGQKKQGSASSLPYKAIPLPYEPIPLPLDPIPIFLPVSGLYEWRLQLAPMPQPVPIPEPVPEPIPEPLPIPIPEPGPRPLPASAPGVERFGFVFREELRLDVDNWYPQMVASGTIHGSISHQVHWVANLVACGLRSWKGNIWYKDGAIATFPYTTVEIKVSPFWPIQARYAEVTFSGGGGSIRVRTFKFKSRYFRPVDFEFDYAEGELATVTVDPCAHPNHPTTISCGTLSVQTVYNRSGFNVTTSPGGPVALSGAGPNATWSDQEMHDAMQTYWSRFASKAQWAIWAFFASLHDTGTNLGGIMFDDIGPNHRQGCAIFNDSFISVAPPGDANPTAWVERMIFWTACHEMGHCFNLAHSWDKQHPQSWGTSWIPLTDEPEARSFMNYPYYVSGGQTAFFSDFEYRFSDGELLFMRHAPARFVQPGNADWFDNHGFQQANVYAEPTFSLEVRANREQAIFAFMEPVTLELKLTNISLQPKLVDEHVLSSMANMTVILKKAGKAARQFFPYAQYCWQPEAQKMLKPGESVYESVFVSAGLSGWNMAEPGNYVVQIALHMNNEDIVSNKLRLRVSLPGGYDEEFLAQDFFSDDVGRIIAFGGSRFFTKGNDTLHEIANKLRDRIVAIHASLAVGNGVARQYKQLVERSVEERRLEPRKQLGIKIQPAQPKEARKLLAAALTAKTGVAVESFGHIEFKRNVDRFSDWLEQQGEADEAVKTQEVLYKTMSIRQVHGRKILDVVVQDIKKRRDGYKTKK